MFGVADSTPFYVHFTYFPAIIGLPQPLSARDMAILQCLRDGNGRDDQMYGRRKRPLWAIKLNYLPLWSESEEVRKVAQTS